MSESDEVRDSTRLAISLLKQEQDEDKIRELEKRVSKLEKSVFAAQIGSAVIIGVGLFIGWLASTGNTVRSWFH